MTTSTRSEAVSEIVNLTPVHIEVTEEQFGAFNALINTPLPSMENLESLANMPSPFYPVTDERIAQMAQNAGKGPIDLASIPTPFLPILDD